NKRATIQFIGENGLDFTHVRITNLGQQGLGDFVIGIGNHFTGVCTDHILGQHTANQIVFRHGNAFDLGVGQFAQVLAVDTLVFFDKHSTVLVGNVETSYFALPALGHHLHQCAFG